MLRISHGYYIIMYSLVGFWAREGIMVIYYVFHPVLCNGGVMDEVHLWRLAPATGGGDMDAN